MRFLDGKEEIASLQEIGKRVQENARFTTFYGGHVAYKGQNYYRAEKCVMALWHWHFAYEAF